MVIRLGCYKIWIRFRGEPQCGLDERPRGRLCLMWRDLSAPPLLHYSYFSSAAAGRHATSWSWLTYIQHISKFLLMTHIRSFAASQIEIKIENNKTFSSGRDNAPFAHWSCIKYEFVLIQIQSHMMGSHSRVYIWWQWHSKHKVMTEKSKIISIKLI